MSAILIPIDTQSRCDVLLWRIAEKLVNTPPNVPKERVIGYGRPSRQRDVARAAELWIDSQLKPRPGSI
jgi:hypothetical protein